MITISLQDLQYPMHEGMTDSAKDITVIRKISNAVSNKTNRYSLTWRNKRSNIVRVNRKSMRNIQRSQLNYYLLTKVDRDSWIIVVNYSILKIRNGGHIEPPSERCHDNTDGFSVGAGCFQTHETN